MLEVYRFGTYSSCYLSVMVRTQLSFLLLETAGTRHCQCHAHMVSGGQTEVMPQKENKLFSLKFRSSAVAH